MRFTQVSGYGLKRRKETNLDIEIKEITKETANSILQLQVSAKQKGYIESTRQCLTDALECSHYKPAGLYKDGILIGFAMYGYFPKEGTDGRVWLDRFFIDEKYQGYRLGSVLLEALIRHLTSLYHCNKIFLSVYEDNQHALYLFQKFGFVFNGELDINNEKVMVRTITSTSNKNPAEPGA